MLIIAYPRDPDFLVLTPFIKLDPQHLVIDRLLQDRKLILLVANDLALSAPQALWNGRPATPVVVTLRVAVARRLNHWSYRTVEKEINGSMQWRWFCALEAQPCPDFSTLRDREALIRPLTLHHINDRVVRLAQREGVTQGEKLRGDGSVIETHIHYPTDSSLLADSMRSSDGPWWQHDACSSRRVSPTNNCFGIHIAAPSISRARLLSGYAGRKDKKAQKIRQNGAISI